MSLPTLREASHILITLKDITGIEFIQTPTELIVFSDSGLSILGSKGAAFALDNGTITGGTFHEGGSVTITSYGKVLVLKDDNASAVKLDSKIKTADASIRTKAITITGNTLDNSIRGGSGNDSLIGGAGKDSLYGGKGNDTLTGGNGNDLFICNAGNDVITDYATGDKISLGAAITKATVSGSNVVFTTGNGTLTVQKAKGKTLSLIDSKGKEYSTVVGGTTLTLTNSKESVVTVGAAVKVIDASARTKAVKITGNKLANSIVGGSGNDTLYGGQGNDTLWGGKGNDSLYGGDGKDRIFDYQSGDMLKILKSNGKDGGTFKSSKYSGGDLTLTINGGGTVIFDGVSQGDKFNINGKTYTLSGSKLK